MFNDQNTYILRKEETDGRARYFIGIRDGSAPLAETEVSESVFLALEGFAREDRSQQRQDRRRAEQLELSDEEMYHRARHKPKSVEDALLDRQQGELLEQAIADLPETQRRRFVLHHELGMTYAQIAEMEECVFQAVAKSVKAAEKKIKKKIGGVG